MRRNGVQRNVYDADWAEYDAATDSALDLPRTDAI